MRTLSIGCLLVGCLLMVSLAASPAWAQDIPPQLRDWQGWVLHDQPQHACPFLTGSAPRTDGRHCLWPGELTVAANDSSGHFQVTVEVDAKSWLGLPGDTEHWPQQVTDNGQPAVVHDSDGMPRIRLSPGRHIVRGQWRWLSRPARLALPDIYGLLGLTVDGQPVTAIDRGNKWLTLGESVTVQHTADALQIKVFRRLSDGLPPSLETRLQIDVSGSARGQLLGPVLPQGFVATRLDTRLPARLDPDGRLRLQLRPGHWVVTLAARGIKPLSQIGLKLPPAPWPKMEVWSYADDPGLRQTRVEGQAMDAGQAGAPKDWRNLPTFLLNNRKALAIKADARAGQGGKGDRLQVERHLWLDFSGDGFMVRDHVRGTMTHPRRLDVASPWLLQSASEAGNALLVSKSAKTTRGIELRAKNVNLVAGLRLPHSAGKQPVAGWQTPIESITAQLDLPSGYQLLGTTGVDGSPDSWVAQWTLLDLFLVALVALLCGRLLGWPMALLAGGYMALAHQQAYAPSLTLLLTAALALLVRALPSGRLRIFARIAAFAFIIMALLWALPFTATQLRDALYPQLAAGPAQNVAISSAVQVSGRLASKAVMQRHADEAAPRLPQARIAAESPPAVTDQGLVQTGPGMSHWHVGNSYKLNWSGPVLSGQQMRLVIAPSWLVRVLRVLAVLGLACLLARLLLQLLSGQVRGWRLAVGSAALVMALLPGSGQAQQIPSPELLQQLQQRLLKAPECAPECAVLAHAQLSIDGRQLHVLMQAHVEATVAVPMPIPGAGLELIGAHMDGVTTGVTADGGQPLVRMNRGVHSVLLDYRIQADSFTLRFSHLRPKRMQAKAQGWTLSGITDARLVGDTVSLKRNRTPAQGEQKIIVQTFPTYVHLTRTLRLGDDWRVSNVVQRIAPNTGGFTLGIPLLPGEHPLNEDAHVHDGRIDISFSTGQQRVQWSSRIKVFDKLVLKAPELAQRSETWQIAAASIWHVEADGVPPSSANALLRYQPLPGEQLKLSVSRPVSAGGDSIALDSVSVRSRASERASETTLELKIRSTRGGEHRIVLPKGASLLDASRDGKMLALALRDDRLSLPLRPGSHDYRIRLRTPQGVDLRTRMAPFDFKMAGANINLQLQLPRNRWVLWAWGPSNGPVVLYWSQLLVLALAGLLLARFAPTPLRFHHWLLLGLGFSTFAWSAFALVVAWLILLGLRLRLHAVQDLRRLWFNLMQAALAALTVLAVLVLIGAIPRGLLGLPDMHVAGNGSSAWRLRWFVDRSSGQWPQAGVFSLPLWIYKAAILAWALWLANALVGWLRWAFKAWSTGGYWRSKNIVVTQADQQDKQTLAPSTAPADE